MDKRARRFSRFCCFALLGGSVLTLACLSGRARAQDTANSSPAFWIEEAQRRARLQSRPDQRIRRLMPRREFARPTIWHERPLASRPAVPPAVLSVPPRESPPAAVAAPSPAAIPDPPASSAPVSSAAAAPLPTVQKPFVVAVVGDNLAEWLAAGIEDAFPAAGGTTVLNKARDSSGLVRDDFYDWPKALRALVANTHLDAIAIMVGSNDRQPLRGATGWDEPLSKGWQASYERRLDALLTIAKEKNVPVLWVGLPIMKNERFTRDMETINELERTRAEAAGATFVDVFDAFADDKGQYSAFGPDVNGTIVKLRTGDGVNFTPSGARKLAHFLEGDLRRLRDATNPPVKAPALVALPSQQVPTPATTSGAPDLRLSVITTPEPTPGRPAVGPVIPLTASPSSPGGELLGGANPATRVTDAQRAALETQATQASGMFPSGMFRDAPTARSR